MNRELTVRIAITPGLLQALLLASLVSGFPAVLGSETVTLQTYYPAPYGIYTQLRTMNLTTLAETGGSVAIGNSSAAGNKLRVVGGSTLLEGALTVTSGGTTVTGDSTYNNNLTVSGNMGVGTAAGTYRLDVNGKVHTSDYLYINGSACWVSGANTACGGGTYATFVPGLRTDGNWYSNLSTADAVGLGAGQTVNTTITIQYYCCTS